jgi:adenosylcobinamide-GDP ribazoletransferase
MGADFASGLSKSALMWGGIIPLVLAIALGLQGIIAFGVASLTISFLLRSVRVRIGGITGDVFGLIVEVVETLTLVVLTA